VLGYSYTHADKERSVPVERVASQRIVANLALTMFLPRPRQRYSAEGKCGGFSNPPVKASN